MPIGKDSIQKRVAKATEAAPAEEVKAEVAAEVSAPAQKPAAKTTAKKPAAKSTSAGAKKPAAKAGASTGAKKTTTTKKPAAPKADKPVETAPATAVLSNVAPETVAAVIGHEEGKPSDKVKIGQKMPTYLL